MKPQFLFITQFICIVICVAALIYTSRERDEWMLMYIEQRNAQMNTAHELQMCNKYRTALDSSLNKLYRDICLKK